MPNQIGDGVVMFRLYPRGFLGAPGEPAIKKIESGRGWDGVGNIVSQIQVLRSDNDSELHGSAEVVAFMSSYMAAPAKHSDRFTTLERGLIVALRAWGATRFDQWYYQQFKSPSFGDVHLDFIDDTIRFIMTGKRETDLNIWKDLVGYSDRVEKPRRASELATAFIDSKLPLGELHMTEIIRKWISHYDGFRDMMFTLNIMFGNV